MRERENKRKREWTKQNVAGIGRKEGEEGSAGECVKVIENLQ